MLSTTIHPTEAHHTSLGAQCALASALLLAGLCAIVFATGISQQSFEVFAPPAEYAEQLVASAATLRAIIIVDDLFITAYVALAVLFVRWLESQGPSPMHHVVLVAALAGGGLDLLENHHILSMLTAAELGALPSAGEILLQSVASSLKWLLAHVGFALLGVVFVGRSVSVRLFRFALVFVQLPVGVLCLAQTDPMLGVVLTWLRYGNLLVGFLALALLMYGVVPLGRATVALDSSRLDARGLAGS